MTTDARLPLATLLAGMLMLAGCGGSGTGGANDSAAATPAAAGGMPANWKATDACSILDKATVGQVLGVSVTEASVGLVHEPTAGGGDAATSECTYILESGRASVMTR